MSLSFERETLPVPTDPIDAAQAGKWVSEINSIQKMVSMEWPIDPDVKFLLQFDNGYNDAVNDASPFVQQPVPIVPGRTDKAVRIEQSAINLIANPSFEVDLNGWSTLDDAVFISRDLQYVYNDNGTVSTAAMRVRGQNRPSSPYVSYTAVVEANHRYSASAWIFSPSAPAMVQVELGFTGGTPSNASSPPVSVPAGKWTRVSVSDAFSGNNTSCTIRVRLTQTAPSFAIGSRVSSWAPVGTCSSKSTSLQIYAGDVILAAVTNDPSSNGVYQFHMATATAPGPADPGMRLDDAAQAPIFAAGSSVSIYRPSSGDTVPVTDNSLQLNAGDLVFCKLSGKSHGFAMVTTGALGAANTGLRLNDDGSPPDFEGTRLSRFVPAGTSTVTSTSMTLADGDMAFCHLVNVGHYDFVPVTAGGTGPGDLALCLADESGPPNFAAGSRLSYLTPTHTALATDTSIPLAAGDALLAYTVKAPMATAYGFHLVTMGGTGPADPSLRVDDGPTTSEVWVDCVQLEEGRCPSSYLDHLQGLGYSGLATTSTSRSAGTLSYPMPAGLSVNEGTIAFWFQPNFNSADGEAHFLVDMAEAEFTNRLFIRKDVANRLALAVYDDQDGMQQISTSGPFGWSAGDWVHIAATWKNGALQLYYQGQPMAVISSGSGTGILGVVPDTIYVGSSFLGFNQADGLLTDLVFKGKEALPDAIAAIASSPTGYLPTLRTLQAVDIPILDHWKISDFDTQVHSSRLDQMAAPTSDVSMNSHRLTNVTDPSSAQDAATKNYVETQVSAINPMTGMGDVLYGGSGGAVTRLGANTATRKKFLHESGTGSAGNAPVWGTIGGGDLRDIYVAATGSADTYSATPNPAPSSMNAGMLFLIKIPATNTGASTLNLNSLGATSIKTQDGSDPAAGALVANGLYLMAYDGTNFQLV